MDSLYRVGVHMDPTSWRVDGDSNHGILIRDGEQICGPRFSEGSGGLRGAHRGLCAIVKAGSPA